MATNFLQSIENAAKTAGSLVEAYILGTPEGATVQGADAFVKKNVDLLVNHFITNPALQGVADLLVNEIIDAKVPAFYAQQMQKLGGIPVAAADPTAAQLA